MVQGPIQRFQALQPQLLEGHDFSAANIKCGLELMLWGILKKAFLADPLARAVANIYDGYTQYSGVVIFLGAALYCLQLYCDFSGGTDLVRGASMLFGVRMAENFRRPYLAHSLDEFWRRWHISLGDWMKDYLFYPLALSAPMGSFARVCRKRFGPYLGKMAVPCVTTVIVFLAVGVWQGPGMANIAYGLWNGLIMSLSMLCTPLFRRMRKGLHISEDAAWFRLFQILRTCLLVVIGRYFSRAGSLTRALGMLKRTIGHLGLFSLTGETFLSFGLTGGDWIRLGIGALILLTISVLLEKGVDIRQKLMEKPMVLQFLLLFAAVLLVVTCVYLNSDYTAIMYVYENI